MLQKSSIWWQFKLRDHYMKCDEDLSENPIIDITVSYDNTLHNCSHSSHFKVAVVVDFMMGLFMDTAPLSNYCQGCKNAPAPTDATYSAWKARII